MAGFVARAKMYLVGSPLQSDQLHHQRIPKWKALAVLSSDALSSVAYATEEVLIPLSLLSAAAVSWAIPIAFAILFLLVVVTISYRQTIDAYPNGGGAYTVAKENLGTQAGLVAGASLLIDYVLTVAVSVAAGVENTTAAFPFLEPHKEAIGVVVIIILATMNLRGISESASVFAAPTYMFILSFILLIGAGIYHVLAGDVVHVATLSHTVYPAIPLFLILRAFASGCSALTGVEAISNGIPIFRAPSQKNAKTTMLWMSTILGVFFLGMTLLAHAYGIIPKEGETVVSLLSDAVFGRTVFYYFVQASTALILILAANTSYADFPRLASLLSRDGFLPRQLSSLGDRLVFSNGILGLSLAAILLIVAFEGDTHNLIPLYAVGVFLSFTLSQSGMVIHHLKTKHPGWIKSIAFNGVGAVTTAVVLLVIASAKFLAGAWIVITLIPALCFLFNQIRKHYVSTAKYLAKGVLRDTVEISPIQSTAIVPVSGIHPGVLDAVRYAISISTQPRAVCVSLNAEQTAKLQEQWAARIPQVPLIVLPSPYRSIIRPILDYIDRVSNEHPNEVLTVIIPEFVTRRWYHKFLHNQTALVLYAALRAKEDVVVTSVRHHL